MIEELDFSTIFISGIKLNKRYFLVGTYVSNFSKLRKFGIKEGSIVFFVSDLPYKAIMSYLHIYIMGYYFKSTPSGYKRFLLLGIGNSR